MIDRSSRRECAGVDLVAALSQRLERALGPPTMQTLARMTHAAHFVGRLEVATHAQPRLIAAVGAGPEVHEFSRWQRLVDDVRIGLVVGDTVALCEAAAHHEN